MQKRGGGGIRYLDLKFVSQYRKILGTIRRIRNQKISGIEIFLHEEGISRFSVKLVCLTVPKNFVGEPFCVSGNFGYRNILCIRRGYHYSPLKFCLTVPKNFAGEPFNVSENFGYRKILCIRRGYHYSLEIFRLSAEKLRRGTLLCFKKIPVSKLFMHRRGWQHGIVEKSFVSQDRNEKLGKGSFLFSRKFLVSKKIYGEKVGFTILLGEIVNVSEIVKIFDTAEIRTRTYRFRTLLS